MKNLFLFFIILVASNLFGQDTSALKSKTIKEVHVTAQKPQIKVEAGKTSLDASTATIQQGTLKDLILQMPGVVLDNNNNVSVKGKSGLRILIDGKTSQMALSDMKTFMETLPASSIKSIEILTNPGAQYDAEGKSGIISIKLKKDKREGLNTKLSAGVGSVLNKYSGGIFSNYKNESFNLFGNYQFNYKDQWYNYREERIADFQGTKNYYNYIASWKDYNRTHNIKSGIDLFINKNTTIGYTIDYNANIGTGNNYEPNPSETLDENGNLLTRYDATNKGKNNVNTLSNGLSFKRTFDSSKAEWTCDISHTYFTENQTNVNENNAFDKSDNFIADKYYYFETDLNNRVHNLMMKTDISLPTNFAKFDFGLKNESNFNQNIYKAYLRDYGKEKYTTPEYNNDFNYNENIFATYLTANKTFGFIQLDVGARLENTIISSNNPEVSRQYLNLFPNIGVSSPLDSFTSISMRFSRRIDRPSFNQLNNRKVYYNRYTANVGVPSLQPEISNVISAQLDRNFLHGALNLSLGVEYNIEENDIAEFTYIDSSFTSFFTSGNIGSANLFNTYLNIYFKPSKKWDINLTPQFLYSKYSNTYKGIISEVEGSGFQLSGQIGYVLPLDFKLSLNGFMNTNMIWAQGNSNFIGAINASITKSFLKDKLNLSISCQDLLNSNIWTGFQNTGNINSKGIWKPETRIAWLNMSYSFGKKINYQRKEMEKSDRLKGTGR